jgi:hypothetical protein
MTRKARRGNPSFTFRMPAELRAFVQETSEVGGISEAAYLCFLVHSAMGKRPRRPSKQHVVLREGLAEIHAALIAVGNQVASPQAGDGAAALIVAGLADVVATLLRLEDAVRGE